MSQAIDVALNLSDAELVEYQTKNANFVLSRNSMNNYNRALKESIEAILNEV